MDGFLRLGALCVRPFQSICEINADLSPGSLPYRFAPKWTRLPTMSTIEAPLEDIYSVFVWLHANAGQLGLDPARIGIKGESGGGGFAAGAALYARDRQGPKF